MPLEEKAFGTESLPVSTTLNRMGISERDLGKFKEAEDNLKRALSIREEKSAPESWILISLENLASVYIAQGQEAKAVPLMARVRAIRSHSSSNYYMMGQQGMNIGGISALENSILIDFTNSQVGLKSKDTAPNVNVVV